MDIRELRQIMRENGVIGAGGAGFPSYAKLDERTDIIILNCAECEPLLKVHRQLLAKYAYEILEALQTTAQAVKAEEIVVAVKRAYTAAVEAVERQLAEKDYPIPVRIGFLPEVYPAGDEVITIYETTGRVVPPGKIPIDVGAAVFNVETMYNVYRAVYRKKSVTHKYLTIAGEVGRPRTVRVPVGITIGEAVALAGGVTAADPVYIHGGPMTGPAAGEGDLITKTSNAVLVLDRNHPVVRKKLSRNSVNMKRAMACCCQCRMCTDLCPRNLIGHPIQPHAFMRAATSGVTRELSPFLNTFFCSQCGLCEMYACNQGLSPRMLIGEYKNGLKKAGVALPAGVEAGPVNRERDERRVPMERLIARLCLTGYDVPAPLSGMPEEEAFRGMVRIRLNQHIGVPAAPTVGVGELVREGQKIAQAPEGKLSVCYHASCDGEVEEVTPQYVLIRKSDNRGQKGQTI